jgi:cyanate lyase
VSKANKYINNSAEQINDTLLLRRCINNISWRSIAQTLGRNKTMFMVDAHLLSIV